MLDKLKESRDKLAGIKTTAQETLKSIGETEQLKADLTLTVSSVDKALAPLAVSYTHLTLPTKA